LHFVAETVSPPKQGGIQPFEFSKINDKSDAQCIATVADSEKCVRGALGICETDVTLLDSYPSF
jgi:hypothetical protein